MDDRDAHPGPVPTRRLLDAVGYDELRAIAGRIARLGALPEPDATSLLHEAITNWMTRGDQDVLRTREAALAAMVAVIRNAAIDRARRRGRASAARAVDPAVLDAFAHEHRGELGPTDAEDVGRALDELRDRAPRAVAAMELRALAGLELAELADALGVSVAQVKRDLALARAFVRKRVAPPRSDA